MERLDNLSHKQSPIKIERFGDTFIKIVQESEIGGGRHLNTLAIHETDIPALLLAIGEVAGLSVLVMTLEQEAETQQAMLDDLEPCVNILIQQNKALRKQLEEAGLKPGIEVEKNDEKEKP
jgi:hypothetical protein